jgi:dGTPase
MTPRKRWEKLEYETLAPWAAKAAESQGRPRPEPEDALRTCFARDRDRVIHCKAFRRLKHKTQVFIAPEIDHYRTRLTHTLEVAQIARTVARCLRLNEDLTEAIALAHDLGHTPFGHQGEIALDGAMREIDSDLSFNHVEQSLRVVDIVERDGAGLNLCQETRWGIREHSKGRGDLRALAALPSTLESAVVRIADRIAYTSHDIDDAIAAGVIEPMALPADAIAVLGNTHKSRINTMVVDVVAQSAGQARVAMSSCVGEAMETLKEYMFDHVYLTAGGHEEAIRTSQEIVTGLFHRFLQDPGSMPAAFRGRYEEADSAADRARAVADYVAGMTDRYAQNLYREGSSTRSVNQRTGDRRA